MLRIKTKTVHASRLINNATEREALRFLYDESSGSMPLRGLIIDNILGQSGREFYHLLTKEECKLQQLCEANYELVESIVDTLFQWFGTAVGSSKIEELLESIKKQKDKPEEEKEFRKLKEGWDAEEAEEERVSKKAF